MRSVLIALADLRLHLVNPLAKSGSPMILTSYLGTKSVQYLELRPEQSSQAWARGEDSIRHA